MPPKKILITGANGQLGQVLSKELINKYGKDAVLSTDIRKLDGDDRNFEFLDILNVHRLYELVHDYNVTEIYHLAAILSASGEWNPQKTWDVNFNGLMSVLNLAKSQELEKVFFPSTIAIFGDTTPKIDTPQHTSLMPETVYGMSKVTGEMWCRYYHVKYGVDVRSLRYPGVIGYQTMPGGGTTDYAVEIFHAAVTEGKYECFLEKDTKLPMIYMPDLIDATLKIMYAPDEQIKIRSSYNLAAISFTPEEIAVEIKKHIPNFEISYVPDYRQQIAESWTESIDDSHARQDWGWQHQYDLEKMVSDMIYHLKKKYNK